MAVNTVVMIISLFIKVSTQCTHGEVRLVNGSVPSEGRIEVCVNSNWGTVCDMGWGPDNAKVVCRQLGYTPDEAIAKTQAHYGQGLGHIWLDNVRCTPATDMKLLECPHRFMMPRCTHTADAGVKCRDDQGGVKNISATIINPMYTVLITWALNNSTQADVPIRFEIECYSEEHSIAISVSNETLTTSLGGLLPSTSYTCCVSVVYESYTARRICTEIETSSYSTVTIQERASNSTNVVGGVLGFITAVLLVLLALSGIAVVYLLRPSWWKERLSAIIPSSFRLSGSVDKNSTIESNMPVRNNPSYMTTPSNSMIYISRAHSQAVLADATNRDQDEAQGLEYSRFGPDYETIDSRRQSQRKNQVHTRDRLLSERYEYSEAHLEAATAAGGEPEVSADYEVPSSLGQNVCTEDENYSHLKH